MLTERRTKLRWILGFLGPAALIGAALAAISIALEEGSFHYVTAPLKIIGFFVFRAELDSINMQLYQLSLESAGPSRRRPRSWTTIIIVSLVVVPVAGIALFFGLSANSPGENSSASSSERFNSTPEGVRAPADASGVSAFERSAGSSPSVETPTTTVAPRPAATGCDEVLTLSSGFGSSCVWSVAPNGANEVWSMSLEDGSQRQLLYTDIGHRFSDVAVSPDGQRLVFVLGNGRGQGELWLSNIDGVGPEYLPSDPIVVQTVLWVDDSTLAVEAVNVEGTSVELLDVATGERRPVSPE